MVGREVLDPWSMAVKTVAGLIVSPLTIWLCRKYILTAEQENRVSHITWFNGDVIGDKYETPPGIAKNTWIEIFYNCLRVPELFGGESSSQNSVY